MTTSPPPPGAGLRALATAALLLALPATGGSSAWAQSLPFRCWTIADGLAQTVVNAILEDSQGYVWIGTASGLSRFDGQRFENFDLEHGLPSPRVYALLEDQRGVLWAGTDRGVGRFERDRFERGRWSAPFSDSEVGQVRVVALAEQSTRDGARQLVIGTRGAGLFLSADGSSLQAVPNAPATITGLASTREEVWVGSRDGLFRLGDGQLTAAPAEAPFAGSEIQALSIDEGEDRVLIAGTDGAFSWDPVGGGWRQLVEAGAGRLMAISPSRMGRRWLGTHHQGLLRVDGKTVERYGRLHGLPVDGIRALALHSDGGLWIGTYGGGICRLDHEAFGLFTEDHGLPNNQVLGLTEGPSGELWIGMLEGGVSRFDGHRFESFGRDHGLRSLAVSHLAVDDAGVLWVGTLRGGLHRLRRSGGAEMFESVELPTESTPSIFHIMVDRDGVLWLSTFGTGLVRFDARSNAAHVLTSADGLLSDRIFSTSQAEDGDVWIATPAGVQVLEPEGFSFTGFSTEQDPPDRVRGVLHGPGGVVLLTTDRGLARWQGERFHYMDRQQGLASNTLYLAAVDQHSRLWLGTERGLDRLILEPDGALSGPRHFGAAEGFVGVETNQNSVLEDSQGRLWFGTRGLARFDPAEEPPEASPPRLHLTGVRLFDGTPLTIVGGLLELNWLEDDLIFELTGLDFRAPDALRYQYRLLGHSERWSPPSPSRTAVFPHLTAGRYTFEARVSNRSQVSQVVQLDLVISPPYWASWWFRGLLIVTFGLLAALYVGQRVTGSRRRRLQLESAVVERTRELETAKQEAEAASEAKTEFLSNMSHELRTPLTGVVSAAELLAKTSLDSKQERLVGTIETSGRVLLSVINDILDQSRIEALGLLVEEREFSPEQCFEECLSVIRPRAEAKDLALTGEVEPGVPERAIGDPVRFRQVLVNLLGNAVKFTEKGQVSASMAAGDLREDRQRLLIEVRDSGIGIAPEVQQRIFEPFQQADTSHTRSYGGTGLGLSICDRLVTMMGGTLKVESEVGVGSIFRFDIDVGLATGPAVEKVAEPQKNDVRQDLTILLAEDNLLSQVITSSQLESLGLRPVIVSNGREAVAQAAEQSFDVIFMDGQMPEMDGYTASRQIRAMENEGDVVIIGLTAHATSEARGRCLAAGMNDYLAKPVQVSDLADRLASWFPVGENRRADG